MWSFLKSLFSRPSKPAAQSSANVSEKVERYTIRLGEMVKAGEVFDARTSGELSTMLKALNKKTNLIDRHFLLMGIVDQTYRNRTDAQMRELCKQISELHIQEFPSIAPALKKEMDGILPRVTTFQHYATLLSEQGEFDKAISVCEQALSYGLHDNTQAGFEGRIERIKRQGLASKGV